MGKKAPKSSKPAAAATGDGGGPDAGASFPASLLADPIPPHLPYRTVLDNYIWTVDGVLSAAECRRWIDHVEQNAAAELQYTRQRATRYAAARECFRLQREDPATARRLWARIPRPLLRSLPVSVPAVGCNPNLRLYKYAKGHAFGMHIDESHPVALPDVPNERFETRLTVLVYLSECRGGATRFAPPSGGPAVAVQPAPGRLLLHLHGADCLPHQGDAVEGGTKYVLRTDLVYPMGAK